MTNGYSEQFSGQGSDDELFADIMSGLSHEYSEPTSETLQQFADAEKRLQRLADPILTSTINVTYPTSEPGGSIDITCNRWNVRGTDTLKASVSFILRGDEHPTISAVAGKAPLTDKVRWAIGHISGLADTLTADRALWLRRACMNFNDGVVPDEEIDDAIMELFVDPPYTITERQEMYMTGQRFNNGSCIDRAQWSYTNRVDSDGRPPHVTKESIRLHTPDNICYTYHKTFAGVVVLTVASEPDVRSAALPVPDPTLVLKSFQNSQELGIGKVTDDNLVAFTNDLNRALAWGPVVS